LGVFLKPFRLSHHPFLEDAPWHAIATSSTVDEYGD
jgi:hypothetical protein